MSQFFQATGEDRQTVYKEAQDKAAKIENASDKFKADVYVKTMAKVMEKGDEFIGTEIKRVEKLSGGSVSSKKKGQLKERVSILTSFQQRMKDEL